MDLSTILGLVVAFGAILGGQVLEGGHIGSVLQPTAAIIVFGGTIGLISCFMGMNTQQGAEGVGKGTTGAVVTSTVIVLLLDTVLTKLLLST